MINSLKLTGTFLTVIFLSACATKLAQESPPETDLSGTWLIDAELSQSPSIPVRGQIAGNRSGGGSGNGGRGRGQRMGKGQGQGSATASQGVRKLPAVMTATEMTIEQSFDSMGIEVPDASYRDVNWGETEKFGTTTVAGWDGDKLVVKTESARMEFSEVYELLDDGNTLALTIETKGHRGTNEFVRVFRKKLDEGSGS